MPVAASRVGMGHLSSRASHDGDRLGQAVMLTTSPNYMTELTAMVEQRHGVFAMSEQTDDSLIKRGPYRLDNGAIYEGYWSAEGARHGPGKQMWLDGSKYDGMWANDRANGRGRLIHSDGSMYEG